MLKSIVRPLAAVGLLAPTVVAQTPPVARPLPVAVAPVQGGDSVRIELRVVAVGGESAGKLFETAGGSLGSDPKSPAPKTATLTGEQVSGWLERVTADRSCTVMAAPRVTVFDGQSANVAILDSVRFITGVDVRVKNGNTVMVPKHETVDLGTTLRVSGTVSADKKSVKLGLKYHDKRLAGQSVPLHPVTTLVSPVFEGGSQGTPVPFTQFIQQPSFQEAAVETAAVLPDGGTVAVHAGKRTVPVRSEFGPPVLSQIPYVNRLFKNTGIGETEQEVVVLATVRRMADAEVKPVVYTVAASSVPTLTPTPYSVPLEVRATRASAPSDDDLTQLLIAYRAACAAGKKDEAARLAVQALAKDPTCFADRK